MKALLTRSLLKSLKNDPRPRMSDAGLRKDVAVAYSRKMVLATTQITGFAKREPLLRTDNCIMGNVQ